MASYRGHLMFSSALGSAYGAAAVLHWHMDWGPACLGAAITAVGGLLPDLDSDSSVPVREVFGLAATLAPLILIQRVENLGFSFEQTLVVLCGVYVLIRYGLRLLFGKLTVHRGMFHSIPAMMILGLLVLLGYHSPNAQTRLYLAGGAMLGFLSHLVLDQLYDVNLLGAKFHPKQPVGGPLKLISPSWTATLGAYALLAGLAYLTAQEFHLDNGNWPSLQRQALGAFWTPHR
jgi:membrane-bound metal-dependent hydrolase YbcI (DUF457 family)